MRHARLVMLWVAAAACGVLAQGPDKDWTPLFNGRDLTGWHHKDATTAADETALMVAALRGNLEWTRRLLDLGAALNRPGWTALHYAASGPDLMVLKLLLERGAQIDALSPNRSTPLMMAAGYGPHESALWLLAGGASRLLRNDRDMSAADFARSVGRDGLALQLEPPAR